MPAAHHPPIPPGRPAQWFVFGGWVFDITAAVDHARCAPRDRQPAHRAVCRRLRSRPRPRHNPAARCYLTMALICHRLFSPICRFPQWPGFGRPPRSDRS
jgi:hypothetical protein